MKRKLFMKFSRKFTLVELMLAMSIFAVLMLILMQIFGSTQDVWRKTGSKADSYESARIALNIIAEDLANAVYVEDVGGKSFHYYNHRLWFVTKKPYTIDTNQHSLQVEVEYRLNSYTEDSVALNNLEYYITTDAPTPGGYDFRTSTTAHLTPSSPARRGILLDNVISFSITPLYIKDGDEANSTDCSKYLPNIVMVSLTVLDNDGAVRTRYRNASTQAEKDLISRTFVRVIPIKRDQEYDISNNEAKDKLNAKDWN